MTSTPFGGAIGALIARPIAHRGLHDAARVLQHAGVAMAADDIVQTLTSDVLAQLDRTGVPFRPGARGMLRALRERGVRTALGAMARLMRDGGPVGEAAAQAALPRIIDRLKAAHLNVPNRS